MNADILDPAGQSFRRSSGRGPVVEARSFAGWAAVTVIALFASVTGLVGQCGNTWIPTTAATNGVVSVMRTLANGHLVAAGSFTTIEGVPANYIALWNGSAWSPLGSGCNGPVLALHQMPNGNLIVGGSFTIAGGVPASFVARWNGSIWSSLGAGAPGGVTAITSRPNGEIFAAGGFAGRAAFWNGVTWTSIGLPVAPPPFAGGHTLATLPNGDVVVGGPWLVVGATTVDHAVRWNGISWAVIPGLFREPADLVLAPNGDLLAAGNFGGPSVLRLQGNVWGTVAPGPAFGGIYSLLPLPNGELLAGGSFINMGSAVPMNNIARWNAQSGWSTFGNGADNRVYSLGLLPDGEVMVGGSFASVDGLPSQRLARLRPNCPATVVSASGGCTGGNPLALQAIVPPWIGAVMRSRAVGFVVGDLAVRVVGVTATSTPLSSLFMQGAPGCVLRASMDVLVVHVPNGRVVDATLTVPDSAALVGSVVHEQFAAVQMGPAGSVVSITLSNSLAVTIGDL